MNNSHIFDFAVVSGEPLVKSNSLTSVNLVYNLTQSGQKGIHHTHRPLLKSLAQNSVVCISKGLANNIPSVVPAHTFLVHQQAHKLGNGDCGMRIVNMDLHIVGNLHKRETFCLVL